MGIMINSNCSKCKSSTKLLIKRDGKLGWWCSVGEKCPYSKPSEESE